MSKVKCMICGKELWMITHNHLKLHNLTIKEYKLKFPDTLLYSDETINNISKARQLFCKIHPEAIAGKNSSMFGKHHSKKSKLKISKSNISKHFTTEESKKNRSESHKGNIPSKKTKKKLSEGIKNFYINNPGERIRVSIDRKKYYRGHPKVIEKLVENFSGPNNPNWKGGKVEIICHSCNKKFKVDFYEKNIRKFCCTKCYGMWISENRRKEKNPSWQNGISNKSYSFGFNDNLKNQIRERDNNICQLCYKTKESNGKRLAVHHIDYNKKNCNPWNLVTLCNSCNSKVNTNRNEWINILSINLIQKEVIK